MSTPVVAEAQPSAFVERIRRDFPILQRRVTGHPLVYLDNAASSQRPRRVTDRIVRYYHDEHANVHRGIHTLSVAATEAYEAARDTVAEHIGAAAPGEVVFTRGTTEAINLVEIDALIDGLFFAATVF